jgi:phosphoribosylformimino-5-aminoimidazole carboxamide ribotide isomerase
MKEIKKNMVRTIEVIPAVDIREGKCVRLTQGVAGTEKVYFDNPIEAALFWQDQMGAKRIHFVDLDSAIGLGDNSAMIAAMTKRCTAKIQIGGGIRSMESARKYIEAGADRIVVGTAAVKNIDFLSQLVSEFGSKKIIVSLDHKQGNVAIKGWTEITNFSAFSLAKEMEKRGAGYILFSAIEADGNFTGPDFENTKKMVETVSIPVIAAGGTRNAEDVKKLKEIGAYGVIIGKALYENKINFHEVKNI